MNLSNLYCDYNHLTSLPPEPGNCLNLHELRCTNNQIMSLPPELGNCVNINIIYTNNPIDHIPPNVARLLDRQHLNQHIYNDSQSVHNSQIQTSIKESILRLLSLKPDVFGESTTSEILSDPVLTVHTKESLVEYSKCTDVHSVLNISFGEMLDHVWSRIRSNENHAEIKRILNQEMADASCMCFTGRISRLVNALNGFDDLVKVNIGDNEQLGTIISLVKHQLETKGQYTTVEHIRIARLRLTELGYPSAVIEEWVGYI